LLPKSTTIFRSGSINAALLSPDEVANSDGATDLVLTDGGAGGLAAAGAVRGLTNRGSALPSILMPDEAEGRLSQRQSGPPLWRAAFLLRATLNERLAGAVTEDLAAPVLDIAIPRTERPARGSGGSTCNAAHDSADRTSDHGPGDDAGRGSRGLLRGLTSCRCEADDSCENELSHEVGSLWWWPPQEV
jgi:hypothetical protein